MQFHHKLQKALEKHSEESILIALGYSSPKALQYERLRTVMNEPRLGFDHSFFDFHLTHDEFIMQLCILGSIDKSVAYQEIEQVKADIAEEKAVFKPYLFVDTGFKRTTQPIFALAACEGQRYLAFEKDFYRLKLSEQLLRIYKTIQTHMEDTGGYLGIWGYIRRYHYVFDAGHSLEITPNGQIVAAHDDFSPSTARISLKSGTDKNLFDVIDVAS